MASGSLDNFLSRNRMASLLAVMTFPIYEIVALFKLLPLMLPPGQVLAIQAVAMFAVWRAKAVLAAAGTPAFIWLALSWAIIFCLGLRQPDWRDMPAQFSPIFFVAVFAFLALERLCSDHAMVWRKALSAVMSACCLCIGAIIAWALLDQAVRYLPDVYDPVLYRIDAMLWLDGAYRLGDLLEAHRVMHIVILDLYEYILLAAIAALFSEVFYTRKNAAALALQLVISSFMVFPLFCLMPALAPAFFFGQLFPDQLPPSNILAMHVIPTNVETIRNTCPSLHATWAILIWLALADSPLWHRLLGAAFLVVTFIATMGFGEHYAVDWVVAMPLVLLVRGICCSSLPLNDNLRRASLVVGAVLLAVWVLTVRGAPTTLELPWAICALAALSVVSFVLIEKRLASAERNAARVHHPASAIAHAR